MAVFEGKKSSNDIINNDAMNDDEVVASYVPPRYLFKKIERSFSSFKKPIHHFDKFVLPTTSLVQWLTVYLKDISTHKANLMVCLIVLTSLLAH